MINRQLYLNRLHVWKDKNVIKVVTGLRRCGKSTLLRLYSDMLRESGVPEECLLTINLEQLENEHLLDYRELHRHILDSIQPGQQNYVFIDEVQNVPDFQKAVDSLYVRDNIDLYITGSNALLLEGTLATLLSGRYIEINMLPLSFDEYVSAFQENTSKERLYSRYISQGSFPATVDFEEGSLAVHDYLQGILNTVLLKDVAQRLNIANTLTLNTISDFLFDNIGNLTSIKGISDTLSSSGVKVSPNTVDQYVSGLVNSYIFYQAKRFDIKGRRILKLQSKFYASDMGMRYMVLGNRIRDIGRILENVVYLELKRRFGEVYIGSLDKGEIDFVVNSPTGPQYFQVSESVKEEKTLTRELTPLQAVKDNNPKTLITFDDSVPINHDGIKQIYAIDWLTEGACS